MGNSVYSTPVVANNMLYIANKDHVFAIAAPGAEAAQGWRGINIQNRRTEEPKNRRTEEPKNRRTE